MTGLVPWILQVMKAPLVKGKLKGSNKVTYRPQLIFGVTDFNISRLAGNSWTSPIAVI